MWRAFLVGALVLILSLAFAPGEAQAHGAHAAIGLLEQATSGDPTDRDSAETKSEPSLFDCTTCCAAASCLAVAIIMTAAMPDIDVPGGAYAISTVVTAYQASRQGLRRPPKFNI